MRFSPLWGRPREAPGLSVGGLQVTRRQVTLKPPTPRITPERKKAPAC